MSLSDNMRPDALAAPYISEVKKLEQRITVLEQAIRDHISGCEEYPDVSSVVSCSESDLCAWINDKCPRAREEIRDRDAE